MEEHQPASPDNNPLARLLATRSAGVVLLNDGAMGTLLEELLGEPLDPLLWYDDDANAKLIVRLIPQINTLDQLLKYKHAHVCRSAGAVMRHPEAVKEVHRRYFASGADIATAASYQGTIQGYMQRGCRSEAEAAELLRRAVQLAVEARDEAMAEARAATGGGRRRLLVAASVGCYGAAKADGSEYRGDYGLTEEELVAWHRPRLRILAKVRRCCCWWWLFFKTLQHRTHTTLPLLLVKSQKAGADLLAFETVPCLVELRALLRLLAEEESTPPCWITVACRDASTLNSGEPLEACAEAVDAMDPISGAGGGGEGQCKVVAFGVNCCPPQCVKAAVTLLNTKLKPGRLLIAYPNSGEAWDGKHRKWEPGSGVSDPEAFAALAEQWVAAGARILGGCCRTTPATIAALRRRLAREGEA